METQVITYENSKAYQKDAKKQAKKGWEPISVVAEKNPRGCLNVGCLAVVFLPLLLLGRKDKIVVTYGRARA